ncbi:hypothetical protein ABZZ79_28545 [Streptomyces sp. NPDC006458]|uniref:hypothetical protein n=1 Tax=Streptomyces sp. NPDC006458 TaxID=3154302 RepID=UPI0033AA24AB
MSRRGSAALWLLPLLAVAACTSQSQSQSQSPSPRPAADVRSDAPTTTPPVRTPVEVEPPDIDAAGESPAGQRQPTHGNAVFAYEGGRRGKALIVAVSCRGRGTVTVDLPEMRVSFRHTCAPGEAAVVQNEFALASAYRPGTVSVRAPSTVTWAVTVGRGEPVEEDLGA